MRNSIGKFYPQGDELLDTKLVKDPLDRLKECGLRTVAAPFEKALRHLLAGEKNSSILADAITDAYEALEAMAKVVTTRHERDLSSNAELFLSKRVFRTSTKNCSTVYRLCEPFSSCAVDR
jgi:hypothetical protein